MPGPDIFLSYNHEDRSTAKRFADAFSQEGFNVWWDTALRSGEAYDEVTENALRTAKAVVVLWSARSVNSRWVRAEATLADRNKTLVPAMIEPCDRPIMFELTQTADLSHWDGDTADRAWKAFHKDVKGFVERGKLREADAGASAQAGAAQSVDEGRPALAIMPFTNRSGKDDDEVFADGMVEDLIAALSTNGTMKVIASSATRSYRNAAYDARQVGKELGAQYLLEGNVRRVGDTLRVTAQLITSETGEILWTHKFDRPLEDLEILQEELVIDVAAALGVQVMNVEVERALKKPGDLTAWEAVVRSMNISLENNPASLKRGLEEARNAVKIAPSFGRAHAQRAMSAAGYFWTSNSGDEAPYRDEAREAARRAVMLDPGNPTVLSLAAQALCNIGMWDEGLACAQRSVELNPDAAAGHAAMIMVCNYYNRPEESLAHIDAYEKLSPRGPDAIIRIIQRSGAHFMAGDLQKALEAAQKALLVNPNFIFAHKDKAIYLEKLGRREEALEALTNLKRLAPDTGIEDYARMHTRSMLAPDVADEFQETLETVWAAADDAS